MTVLTLSKAVMFAKINDVVWDNDLNMTQI